MSSPAILSESDLGLLVEMFCCVIAADKKVSGRELSAVTDALTSLGHSPDANVLKAKVVEHCKLIHKKGVDAYVADLLPRVQRLAGLPLATSFIEAQSTLLHADGASTPDEERVSQQIVECLSAVLAAAEDDPVSDVLLDEPGGTVGASMLGTAKSSMALAVATAERTKLMTVTMPAAFIALGKQCFASKAFTAEFPSNYAAIAKLAEETKATAETLDTASTASTFAGRAKELAGRGMTLATSQKQSVQYQKLMQDLGKAVYESKGAASGPKDLCERIAKCTQRLADLATTVTTHSRQLKSSAAGVGRSVVEAAGSSARTTRSPFAWSKKKLATAAVAGFLGLSIIGSWMDKPDGGPTPDVGKPEEGETNQHASQTENAAGESQPAGSQDYLVTFRQGELMGRNDQDMLSAIEARGQSIDEFVTGRVQGRIAKFVGEVLEAERQQTRVGSSRFYDLAKGRYDGYIHGLGPYGQQ